MTRAARPVRVTCTALRTLTIAPRGKAGSGRIGSIHPCAAPGASGAVSRQTRPGAVVPISVEDDTGILVFTIAGRGVMLLDGDRIEVSANDLVHIPAGVPYGLQTLGGTDWVYVVLQAPTV